MFSAASMSPTADTGKAWIEAPAPTTVAKVHSFLGMANYSANFIPHYSQITAPLRHLTKKNAQFQWTKECQKAHETLKQTMGSSRVMSYYDPTRPTELLVDASKYSLASMLMQPDPKTGQHKVVRNNSRSTKPPESRYVQKELESAAVEFAIKRNHIYLYGLLEFIVITDHKPLLPLYNSYWAYMPSRIHRHKLNLRGYTFKLKHQTGKHNPTDYFSRHTAQIPDTRQQKEQQETQLINHHVNAIIRDDLPAPVTLTQMKMATEQDSTPQRLIQAIQTGYISNTDKQLLMSYTHVFKELELSTGKDWY